jgi:hypothetical protein
MNRLSKTPRRWFAPRSVSRRSLRVPLALEPLENRVVPSVTLQDGGALVQNGNTIDTNTAQFGVTPSGIIFDLETNGQLWKKDPVNGWSKIDSVSASIAVTPSGTLLDMETDGALWVYKNGAWTTTGAPVTTGLSTLVGSDNGVGDDVWYIIGGSLRQSVLNAAGTSFSSTPTVIGNVTAAAVFSDGSAEHYLSGSLLHSNAGGGGFTTLDSNARSFSLAGDNNLYEVTTSDQLFMWQFIAGAWSKTTLATGGVDAIATAPSGALYELTTSGQLVRFNPGAGMLTSLDANVGTIAGSPNGTIFDLEMSGNVWAYGTSWQSVDSNVNSMQAGPNGTLYDLRTDEKLDAFSAGALSTVAGNIINFGVEHNGTLIYLVTGSGGVLSKVAAGATSQVATNVSSFQLGRSDTLDYLTTAGTLFNPTGPAMGTANVTTYGVAGDGSTWYAVNNGGIQRLVGSMNQSVPAGSTAASAVTVSADGNFIYYLEGNAAGNLRQVVNTAPTTAYTLDAAYTTSTYAIAGDGSVYEGSPNTNQLLWYLAQQNPAQNGIVLGFVTSIATSPNGTVFVKTSDTNNSLYQVTPGAGAPILTRIDIGVSQIAVSGSGMLYDLESNHHLWRYTGTWTQVDTTTTAFALSLNGALGEITTSNVLWVYAGGQWSELDSNVKMALIAADGTIVDLETNDTLWTWNIVNGWTHLGSPNTYMTASINALGYLVTTVGVSATFNV